MERELNNPKVRLADIREGSVAAQIHPLQRAAYAVEARRIGSGDFPPLRETLEALWLSTDFFLVFAGEGKILGCLSYEPAANCATITRLVVSPAHFRQGIATALLRVLETRLPAGSEVFATTAELNEPAIRAYEKQGYRKTPGPISPEGIALCRMQKRL